MPRKLLRTSVFVVLVCALAGCTQPAPPPSPTGTPSPTGGGQGPEREPVLSDLPECEAVTEAIAALMGELSVVEPGQGEEPAPAEFEQRACVYASADQSVRLGVTISIIPFLPQEIEAFRELPTAIPDERAAAADAVLQTLQVEGGPADHLDSTLFLFDEEYSIAIQGMSDATPTSESLPQLTVGAAADAAFAIRALIR